MRNLFMFILAVLRILALTLGTVLITISNSVLGANAPKASPSTLPTCDAAFADGLKALVRKNTDSKTDRTIRYKSVADFSENAHLDQISDQRIAEETFRFAYDHRHDATMMAAPGMIELFVEHKLNIGPEAFALATMPFFDSEDSEVAAVAANMLDNSGLLDILTDSSGDQQQHKLTMFVKDLSTDEIQRLSPGFIRLALMHDPKGVAFALQPIDVQTPNMARMQESSQAMRHIQSIILQWNSGGLVDNDTSKTAKMLEQLSRCSSRNARLFVLGVMEQPAFRMNLPKFFDPQILKNLQADSDPMVEKVANQIATILLIETEKIRRNQDNEDMQMRKSKIGLVDLDSPITQVNVSATYSGAHEMMRVAEDKWHDLNRGSSVSWELLQPYRIPDSVKIAWYEDGDRQNGYQRSQNIDLIGIVPDLDHYYGTIWFEFKEGKWKAKAEDSTKVIKGKP